MGYSRRSPTTLIWRPFALGLLLTALVFSAVPLRAPSGPPATTSIAWRKDRHEGFTLRFARGTEVEARSMALIAAQGMKTVRAFFGEPFPKRFALRLFPDRASLTEQWRRDWGAPDLQPECWMVASGTASSLDVLSPAAWKTQACDHDPSDSRHVALVVTHELVHVYHGQLNPRPAFDGMDDLSWFIEGLAVFASGQLDEARLASARAAVAAGRAPAALKDAWSGKDRYGIAGAMVAFVDRTYGRRVTLRLLRCTDQAQILATLGLSEGELLARWKRELLQGGAPTPAPPAP